MHSSFDSQDLQSVAIVLLTHKMVATFPKHMFTERIVTPQLICDKVLMIGFGCELLSMTEIQQKKVINNFEIGDGQQLSPMSNSPDLLGERDTDYSSEEIFDMQADNPESVSLIEQPKLEQAAKIEIKTAKIEVLGPPGLVQTGYLSQQDSETINREISQMCGIVDCQVNNNCLPNVLKISYRINETPLRDIVQKI